MSLIAWAPTQCEEGHLLSVSPGESEEGRDVGSTTIVEFFSYDSCGKFNISRSSKLSTIVRAATWTKHDDGVLAFGGDDGSVFFPKLDDLFASQSEDDDVVMNSKSQKQHSGAVTSFDWNHFQPNLVCSGSTDSSVFIWDLNKPDTHMTPGQGSSGNHADPMLTVAWNLQVQHILGTASSSKATIWDLRKSEPVIRLTDGLCRLKPELLCWSPDVATQLLVASLDYGNAQPTIQLWDLKQPTVPLKSLTGHKEGVISLSWCPHESGLLLSSGKDGTVMLWDPSQGSLIGNMFSDCPLTSHGENVSVESVGWSPIDPGLFIALRNDGTLTLHNILSGSQLALGIARTTIVRERKASRRDVLDAFDQLDNDLAKEYSRDDLSDIAAATDIPCSVPTKPPRWMLRRCCSRFSFANRIVSCSVSSRIVNISQVVTDDSLVARANEVASVLTSTQESKRDRLAQFSSHRATTCEDADVQMVWKFLDASVSDQRVPQYMALLGVDTASIPEKIYGTTGRILDNVQLSPNASQATSTMSVAVAGNVVNGQGGYSNGEASVECTEPYRLPESEDGGDSLIVEGLLSARPELAVDACLHTGRFADALVLSASANQQLFSKTLQYIMKSARDPVSRLISSICLGDLDSVATHLDVAQWPTCLAIIMTYAMDKDYVADLADCLAERLEAAQMFGPAAVCHLVSTNIASFSKCISERINERVKYRDDGQTNARKDLLEHAELLLAYVHVVLPKSAQGDIELDDNSVRTLAAYAKMLVEQGELELAFEVIKMTPNNKLALLELRHRLYHCLGLSPRSTGLPMPSTPFRRLEVKQSPSLLTMASSQSLATEESFNGYAQNVTPGSNVAFQLGGKPMTTTHQAPGVLPVHHAPRIITSQTQLVEGLKPQQTSNQITHMYSPGQFVEHINPDSSNVLAPVNMPTQPSFYDPTVHAAPASVAPVAQQRLQNAPFVPPPPMANQPYMPSQHAASAPPPPLQRQQSQQQQPPPSFASAPTQGPFQPQPFIPQQPSLYSPSQPPPPQTQPIAPPPLLFPGSQPQPQQNYSPPHLPSTKSQQVSQFPPPPLAAQQPNLSPQPFQHSAMAPPHLPGAFQPQQVVPPPPLSSALSQQPQTIPPPPLPATFQPQQQVVPPPPMPAAFQQQAQGVLPPQMPGAFQQQQSAVSGMFQPQQQAVPSPSMPGAHMLQQQQQQTISHTHMPGTFPQSQTVGPPPMPGTFQPQQHSIPPHPLPAGVPQQQQNFPSPQLSGAFQPQAVQPQPMYPAQQAPHPSIARPMGAPNGYPSPYNPTLGQPTVPVPAPFIPQQPPQGPPPEMFNPMQSMQPQGQPYNPASSAQPQQAPSMPTCTVGSAGDMQPTTSIPRVRSYIDRRPSGNWNDPPVSMYSPLAINATDAGHSTAELSPNHAPERLSPQVSADLQPIVDALCQLLMKCIDAAPHGTRKKLEDVDKKMPQLYEKLALKQVSAPVITCLLQLCSAIRNNDFVSATNICQHMASIGQFAEVGQFMLPIKVLLHTAQQLGVQM